MFPKKEIICINLICIISIDGICHYINPIQGFFHETMTLLTPYVILMMYFIYVQGSCCIMDILQDRRGHKLKS